MCLFHVICSDGVLESLKRIGLYNFIELTMFKGLSSTSFDLCMSLHQRLGIAYRKVSWRELGLKLSQRNVREWFRICETGGIICSKISAFQWYSDTQYVRFHTPFMCPWELSIKAPALLANFFYIHSAFLPCIVVLSCRVNCTMRGNDVMDITPVDLPLSQLVDRLCEINVMPTREVQDAIASRTLSNS